MANTKHKHDCSRVFKNYDMTCPRCIELANGSKPRQGWQGSYYSKKALEETRLLKAIKNHNCITANCGPVCTAFDY